MSVVGRGGVADAPLAPGVDVAEVVGHLDDVVRRHVEVVPQQVVVGGLGRPLDPLVTGQVEGELGGVGDGVVHHSPRGHVLVLTDTVLGVDGEQPRLVPLLGHDVGDGRLPVRVNLGTGRPDGHQLNVQNSQKLSFRYSVSIEDDPLRLESSFVPSLSQESSDQLLSDLLHAVNHFLILTRVLESNFTFILRGLGVHRGHHSGDGGLLVLLVGGGVGDVGPHDHDGGAEDGRGVVRVEGLVHSAQLAVDLQEKIVDGGLFTVSHSLLLDNLGGDLLLDISFVFQTIVDEGVLSWCDY